MRPLCAGGVAFRDLRVPLFERKGFVLEWGLCLAAGRNLPAEGRHLDGLGAELHVGQPEPAPDDPAVAEELLDLIGMGRRPDVEILRDPAEQEVADTSADQVRQEIRLVQPVEHLQGVRVDIAAGERMLAASDDNRVDHRGGSIAKPGAAVINQATVIQGLSSMVTSRRRAGRALALAVAGCGLAASALAQVAA